MQNLNGNIAFECEFMQNGVVVRRFNVDAQKDIIGGVHVGGLSYKPCAVGVFEGMSKRYSKAIWRSNGQWWAASNLLDVLRLDLYGVNGKPLGSIFAKAVPLAFDCRLLGFDGEKPARAMRRDGRRFEVRAHDASVSISVHAAMAESRFWMHGAYGAPDFYYS